MMNLKDLSAPTLEDFIASLTGDFREEAEQTILLRDEWMSHTQRMLTADRAADLYDAAKWVTANAEEIAYRWLTLRRAYADWLRLYCGPVRVTLP